MDDRLKDSELEGRDLRDYMQTALSRRTGAPWLLVGLLAALALWFGWEAFGPEDLGDPIGTGVMALEKNNRLTVFSARLSPVVSAKDSRYLDMLESRQIAVIPATVDYTLDLSDVDASDMAWNQLTDVLSVRLPDIEVGIPNLDEAAAQYLREGVWITSDAQENLNRQNSRLAEQQAVEQASNPVLLDLARTAAREAVRRNLELPLRTAGYGDVTVEVTFTGERESD